MRVEWTKTRARAERWSKEVILLNEEMRHILRYFEWKARWWRMRRGLWRDATSATRRGIDAYASKQVALVVGMAKSFAKQWYPMLMKHNIPIDWPVEFLPISSDTTMTDTSTDC